MSVAARDALSAVRTERPWEELYECATLNALSVLGRSSTKNKPGTISHFPHSCIQAQKAVRYQGRPFCQNGRPCHIKQYVSPRGRPFCQNQSPCYTYTMAPRCQAEPQNLHHMISIDILLEVTWSGPCPWISCLRRAHRTADQNGHAVHGLSLPQNQACFFAHCAISRHMRGMAMPKAMGT